MNNQIYAAISDIEGMFSPIGIDKKKPIFHIKIGGLSDNNEICAYQIIVKSNYGKIMWDSKKCEFKKSLYIVYEGHKLKPKTEYCAKVRIWTNEDKPTEYSKDKYFETGFMNEKWEAEWISPVQEIAKEEKSLSFDKLLKPNPEFWGGEKRLRPSQNIRKSFICNKKIKKARLYASSHGVYQININGDKIGNNRLAPETSAYNKILYYQTYDVTKHLEQGENILDAILGDGWWIGRLGLSGESCNYGNRLAFIMELDIYYEDGDRLKILSDDTFKCRESYIRYSDLYIGEKQDFTYHTNKWDSCTIEEYPKDVLKGQSINPIRVLETLEPKKIIITPKGEQVIDFGQVISGVCRFIIDGKEGREIIFEHSEVLDKNGNYKNNILGRNKDQKDVLICVNGKQTFEPIFTYHGFRYVKVTGIDIERVKAKALVIGTLLKKTGKFSCSNEYLNKLQHNIEWSEKANMCSVPTDCPQREKLGWTGDIQIFTKTGCFNYDIKGFLECWLENLRAEQKENGEVPVTVPNHPKQDKVQRMMSHGSNTSSGWGDACVLVPYYLYNCYGDMKVLEDNFETMEKWLEYIKNQATIKPEGFENYSKEQKKRNKYLWTKGFHFGDWLIPSLRKEPDGVEKGRIKTAKVVGACFYAITVETFIEICKVLKKKEKVKQYTNILSRIRDAIKKEFISDDGKVADGGLQGLYVMILRANVTKGKLKEKILKKLVKLIAENNNCLDTGFSSVSYLLDVLYDNGYKELAYKLLFQKKAPSWLYMVKNGATTIWENWLAIKENGEVTDSSYNHYAFGCVGDWIYRHIGGVKIKKPGYREVIIAPDYECGLKYSNIVIETPYGELCVNWIKNKDEIELDIKIPIGITAHVKKGKDVEKVKSGEYNFIINNKV